MLFSAFMHSQSSGGAWNTRREMFSFFAEIVVTIHPDPVEI